MDFCLFFFSWKYVDLMPEILVSTVTTSLSNNPNNPRLWQLESFIFNLRSLLSNDHEFNDSSCDKLKGVVTKN